MIRQALLFLLLWRRVFFSRPMNSYLTYHHERHTLKDICMISSHMNRKVFRFPSSIRCVHADCELSRGPNREIFAASAAEIVQQQQRLDGPLTYCMIAPLKFRRGTHCGGAMHWRVSGERVQSQPRGQPHKRGSTSPYSWIGITQVAGTTSLLHANGLLSTKQYTNRHIHTF